MTWTSTDHAAQKEVSLSHRPLFDLPRVRDELSEFAERGRIVRYRPNGRAVMLSEGYHGKLIVIPREKIILTVTLLD